MLVAPHDSWESAVYKLKKPSDSLESHKMFWEGNRGKVKAEHQSSQRVNLDTNAEWNHGALLYVYMCISNESYLSEIQGDVHLVVLGAAWQWRALPPPLRPVDGVGDGMGAIAVPLAADVTVLTLRRHIQVWIFGWAFKAAAEVIKEALWAGVCPWDLVGIVYPKWSLSRTWDQWGFVTARCTFSSCFNQHPDHCSAWCTVLTINLGHLFSSVNSTYHVSLTGCYTVCPGCLSAYELCIDDLIFQMQGFIPLCQYTRWFHWAAHLVFGWNENLWTFSTYPNPCDKGSETLWQNTYWLCVNLCYSPASIITHNGCTIFQNHSTHLWKEAISVCPWRYPGQVSYYPTERWLRSGYSDSNTLACCLTPCFVLNSHSSQSYIQNWHQGEQYGTKAKMN